MQELVATIQAGTTLRVQFCTKCKSILVHVLKKTVLVPAQHRQDETAQLARHCETAQSAWDTELFGLYTFWQPCTPCPSAYQLHTTGCYNYLAILS